VAVESVQFAGDNIGISGDPNLMVLTSGTLTVDGKVASTTLETSGAATVGTTLDVAGATNLTNTLDVTGATTLGSTVELLADAATVTHSGTTSLSISSTLGYVAVESVQFAGDNIGISGDPNLMVLTSGVLTVDGKVASTTLETSGAATVGTTLDVGDDLTLSKSTAVQISHTGSGSLSISSGGYVAVESVQFAGDNIGINGDPNLMVLTSGTLTVDGKVASTTLETSGAATVGTTLDVGDDLTLSKSTAVQISHTGSGSLSISSGGYVAVESVQFAGDNIGISGDPNLMVLTSGTLTVDGKVASTTLDVTGAVTHGSTLDVAGATNLTNTLDVTGATTLGSTVELLADAATVTHSGTTSLSISSTLGYVAVESVQFAGDNIGISGDPNLMVLTSGVLTVDGKVASTTLETSGAATVGTTLDVGDDLTLSKSTAVQISHTGSGSLSISSGGYVAVESVQFAGDNIGISGDPNLMVLTSGTLTVDGKVASTTLETSGAATVGTTLDVGDDLTLSKSTAVQISHTGSGSLSISSGGYVAVESVQFAGDNIGISGDPNLMVLTSGVLTVDGKVASTTLETSGAATVGTTLDVGDDLTLSKSTAVQISHTGSGSLSISSGGYVAVESVQFAGDNIGINGDPNLMVLTSGTLTVDGKVASTTLDVTGAVTHGSTLDVAGATNLTNTLDVTGATTLGSTVELLADAATVTHSGTTSLSISSTLGYVAVESVQFAGDNIGISGDPNLMVLTSGVLTVDGKVASTTLETSGAATVGTTLDVGDDLTLSKSTAVQISHTGSGSLSISSGGYVAVESVQFAGDNIGISGDPNLMVLTSGVLTVDGKVASTTLETSGAATVGTTLDVGDDLTLSKSTAVQISHTGSGSLSISSGGYVAVESVQFAGDNIGINGDPNLMVLTSGTLTVDGKVASTTLETSGAATVGTTLDVGDDLTLSKSTAVQISHTGSGSLSISSGGYVAVESVQFAGDNIGINGDPNLMVLTSGTLTVDGKVASTTLETSGAATVGTTLDVGDDLTLSKSTAVQISHTGSGSLSISSGGYVAVESVQFAGDNIGISGDPNLMVLTSGTLTVDGKVASTTLDVTGAVTHGSTLDVAGATNLTNTLDVTGATTLGSTVELLADAATVTHSGTTSLSISSTLGYVAVESVQFAGDNIGISGDPNLMVLTSGVLTVDGKVASTTLETSGAATVGTTLDVGDDLTLSKSTAVQISHTGSGSLSISSGGYVAVESVQFAGDNIGISGDPNLMVLTSGTLTVDGKVASTTLETSGAATVGTTLDVGDDLTLSKSTAVQISHTGSGSLSISSGGYVAVESVQFAGDNIGISGDPNLMVLTSGVLTVDGKVASTTLETSGAATVGTTLDVGDDLTLSKSTAVQISHTGSGSLSISSGGYVAVESVQFAGDNIGINGDPNLMVLTSGTLTVDGKVASTTLDVTGAVTHGSTLDVAGATNLTNTLDVTGATTLGSTVELLADAATVTHSGTTSLSISSTLGYVAVESVQFAGDNIGVSGDPNLMVLTSGVLTVDGKVASTTLETSGAATVGTTLDVGDDLTLSKSTAVQISHTGSGSLSISSGGYVAVESVQFAGDNIGISGDPNLMVLTSGTLTVDGKVASTTLETSGAATVGTTLDVGDDLTLSKSTAVQISHTGSGSLSISSGGYVAVESVQFAGDNIGISGDPNLMVLTSGVLTVDGKVASTTLETSGAATVGTTLDVGDDLTLSKSTAVQISHTGSGSLSISSGGYVAVESVQFAGDNIGISGDPNLMVLTSGVLTVDGKVASTTLETSGAATVGTTLDVGDDLTLSKSTAVQISHTGSGSLSISSGGYVAVESVQFAGDNIGINGDPNLMVLTSGTLTVDGKVASTTLETSGAATVGTTLDVGDDLTLSKSTAVQISHTGSGSLSISSGGYVAVESVQFAGDNIGISGDPNLMVLTSGTLTVDGKVASTTLETSGAATVGTTLDVGDDLTLSKSTAVQISHTGSGSLSISSGGYVAVESVQFAGDNIGINGDPNLMVLTSGTLTVDGKVASTTLETSGAATVGTTLDVGDDLTLSKSTAVQISHTGSGSLSISSGGYVAVESVQFAGDNIGINGDPNLMVLTSGTLTVDGKVASTTLETSGAATVGTTLDVGTDDLTLSKSTAVQISHSGSGSLSISSGGYVAVESVQFAGDNIGINGDPNLMVLTSGVLTVDGKVASTTLETSGAATLGGTVSVGGVHADATKELYVNGDIYATGTSTSASDVRFKRNVTSITDALDVARRARAVTFSFQTDAFPERRFPKHAQAGVVAQELEAVLPDLVSTDDRGYKGVAYERLGVYALAAVKELDEEVRSLRATLEAVRKTLERIHDA